ITFSIRCYYGLCSMFYMCHTRLRVRCISPTIISPTPHFTDNYFADSSFRRQLFRRQSFRRQSFRRQSFRRQSFHRQFTSPTVHFTDSSFHRQFISPTTFIVYELVTWLLDLNRVSYFSCILLYAPTLFFFNVIKITLDNL